MAVVGIEINNLLNIRRTTDNWQGSTVTPLNTSFVSFVAPKWGIRAAARILIRYQDRLGKGTISLTELISTWAPAADNNNTNAYIATVSSLTDILPTQEIDITDYDTLFKVIRAMINVEVGLKDYDPAVIKEGLKLAGINPPATPAVKSPAFTVGAVTAVSGAITPFLGSAGDLVNSFSPYASIINSVAHKAPYGIGFALIAGAIYLIWHEIQKRRVQA